MRFALAVVAAAVAQLLLFLRLAGSAESGSFLALVFIVLATLGAGWFAVERAALAGALAVALAAALSAAIAFTGPAGIGLAPLDFAGNVLAVVATFWPYIAIGAICAALGAALRGRVLGKAGAWR